MLEESEVRTIGKYEVLAPLGRGSMGLVYKARDPEIGRQVAIKTLRKLLPTHVQNADMALERFRNEARSAGNLRHPHIITIFEVSRDGDTPYIVMDYVDGESLEQVLEREKKLSVDKMLHYLAQVAEGLDHAHSKGVIHKDIKPANIFVDRSNNVFILDFGIATINESIDDGSGGGGPALGSPGYMSPEQILSEGINSRTDLFSLAIVAFECLTGQRPFPGKTFTEVVGNILNSKPLSLTLLAPELPLALEAEFDRALAKDKSKRFGTAQELIESFAKAVGLSEQRGKGYLRSGSAADRSEWSEPRKMSGAARNALDEILPPRKPYQPHESAGHGPVSMGVKWGPEANPGDLFKRNDTSLSSAIGARSKMSPVQLVTFLLGAVTVVIALVLFYVVFDKESGAGAPQAATQGDGGSVNAPSGPMGELVQPKIEPAPAGLPVASLTDPQLLGILVNPNSPEGLIIDALREAAHRKVPQLVDACVEPLKHDSYVVRIEAIKTVAQLGDRRIVPRLIVNLDDHDPLVRGNAARALGTLGDRAALGYLTEKMVAEEVPEVKAAMRGAIEKINGFPLKE